MFSRSVSFNDVSNDLHGIVNEIPDSEAIESFAVNEKYIACVLWCAENAMRVIRVFDMQGMRVYARA